MRITLDADVESIVKQAKLGSGKACKHLVNELLRVGFARHSPANRIVPLAIAPLALGGLQDAMSPEYLRDLIAVADGADAPAWIDA